MVAAMKKMVVQYPNSYSYWAQTFSQMATGFSELVSVGPNAQMAIPRLLAKFLPHHLILFTLNESSAFPLSIGKQSIDNQYYICKNHTCSAPVNELDEFLAII
jgi:uncharacterized protein YyaL (SSP411 family)